METVLTVSFILSVVAYSVASTLFLFPLGKAAQARFGVAALVAAVSVHASHIVLASVLTLSCPVASIRFSLSVSGWMVAFIFLLLRRSRKLDALGVFLVPLALTFLVASQFLKAPLPNLALSRAMLAGHISSNLLGLGFVLISGASSVFYLVVEKHLKRKSFSALGKFPSLDVLETTSDRMLLIALPFLTLGAVTGGVFFSQIGMAGVDALMRATLGYATWIVVALTVSLRGLGQLSSRRVAQASLISAGFVILILVLYALRSYEAAK